MLRGWKQKTKEEPKLKIFLLFHKQRKPKLTSKATIATTNNKNGDDDVDDDYKEKMSKIHAKNEKETLEMDWVIMKMMMIIIVRTTKGKKLQDCSFNYVTAVILRVFQWVVVHSCQIVKRILSQGNAQNKSRENRAGMEWWRIEGVADSRAEWGWLSAKKEKKKKGWDEPVQKCIVTRSGKDNGGKSDDRDIAMKRDLVTNEEGLE